MLQAIGADPGLAVGMSHKYVGENTPSQLYGTRGYDVKITQLEQSTYIAGRQGEGNFGNLLVFVVEQHVNDLRVIKVAVICT